MIQAPPGLDIKNHFVGLEEDIDMDEYDEAYPGSSTLDVKFG